MSLTQATLVMNRWAELEVNHRESGRIVKNPDLPLFTLNALSLFQPMPYFSLQTEMSHIVRLVVSGARDFHKISSFNALF